MIGVGIPPRGGEVNAAYCADVCGKLQPAWWYDWRYSQIGADGYIPMLYDGDIEHIASAAALVNSTSTLPHVMLLWNEPEREQQADMTPQEAVTALRHWWKRVSPWVVPVAVAGVNVSSHHGAYPYEWLDAFYSLLSDGERKSIGYHHIHVYGPAAGLYDDVRAFRTWMRRRGIVKPVIVSECGTDDNPAALMAMLRAMLHDGVIHMAAWFSAYWEDWNDTGLLDADGNLTASGEAFVAVQHVTHLPLVTA